MSKLTKRRRSRRGSVDRAATTDVVTQLECAAKNPHAAAIGAVVGGLVPWFGRTLAHEEIPAAWSGGHPGLVAAMVAVVLGCACFSAISVYKFGKAAFGDARKALGFVLALEGVLVVAHGVTSGVALGVLIAINAVANGSVIALAHEATQRRCAADARRAATRSRSRAGARTGIDLPVGAPSAPSRSPASSLSRPGSSVGLVCTAAWRRAMIDDAIDAEIVAEHRMA